MRIRGRGGCEHIVKVCFSNFLSRRATRMYGKPGEKHLKPASSFRLRVFQNVTIFATTFNRLREQAVLTTSVSLLSSLTYKRLGPAHSLECKITLFSRSGPGIYFETFTFDSFVWDYILPFFATPPSLALTLR